MGVINAKTTVEFPPIKPQLSEPCRDFIVKCLTPDPRTRPTTEQLLQHPYLVKKTKTKQPNTAAPVFKQPAPPSQSNAVAAAVIAATSASPSLSTLNSH